MRDKYDIIGTSTKLVLRKGRIEDQDVDAIVNWVNVDMQSGPNSFYRIHDKAGIQLFEHTIAFDSSVKEGDSILTRAGMLPCNIVLHAVVPVHKQTYLRCFYNMMENIKTYKKRKLLKTLALYIPEYPDLCLAGVKEFLLDLGLEEVVIVYITDNEFSKITSFFEEFVVKRSRRDRLEAAFWSGMSRLGALRYKWPEKIISSILRTRPSVS